MKKESSHPSLNIVGQGDSFEDNAVMLWLSENGKAIIYALLILAALIFVVYRFYAGTNGQATADYMKADNAWQIFQRSLSSEASPKLALERKHALEELNQIIQRRPELHSKFDGLLAQAYIIENNGIAAQTYGHKAIIRTEKNHLSAYNQYAEGSLAISNQELQKAYDQAKALEASLQTQASNDLLKLYNLIHIASLEQALHLEQQEVATWKKVSAFLAATEQQNLKQLAKERFLQLYSNGSLTLNDYIQQRLGSKQ